MKKIIYLLFSSLFLFAIGACDDLETVEKVVNKPIFNESTSRLIINSEGLFNLNNSTLALYDFKTQELTTNYFQKVNKRGLGDTSNDMQLYGSKLYVVVNVSSQLEILDPKTGVSFQQIPFFDEKGVARQPRYITFHKNHAYVCCFDGNVAEIDTTSLEVTRWVKCGRNPDGLTVSNNKLYVSNSGGLDFPNYDHTVSVVNLDTFQEIKKIEVGMNPGHIEADQLGHVFLISRGDYGKSDYKFQMINSQTDVLEKTFENIQALNFIIHNNVAYIYNYDFMKKTRWVKLFDCETLQISNDSFIPDNFELQTPYGICINPYNGDVYIFEAYNFTEQGDMLCFDKTGKFRYRLNEVGLNPNHVIVLPKNK